MTTRPPTETHCDPTCVFVTFDTPRPKRVKIADAILSTKCFVGLTLDGFCSYSTQHLSFHSHHAHLSTTTRVRAPALICNLIDTLSAVSACLYNCVVFGRASKERRGGLHSRSGVGCVRCECVCATATQKDDRSLLQSHKRKHKHKTLKVIKVRVSFIPANAAAKLELAETKKRSEHQSTRPRTSVCRNTIHRST